MPRHFLRVTPHGVPLTSLALSPRAIGTSPALAYSESSEPSFVAPRERSRRGIRLRTPFLLSCLPPRPTNRPKRVALRSVQPMIARATQESFCNLSPTRRHFSAPQAPASVESGSAQPKPWASSPFRFTREEDRRRHPRAGEVRSRGARSSCSWEQDRPRPSTFAPRHPRHPRATFGGWVLLRVHTAIQIESPRSGAFLRRFPSEALAPPEPPPPCERGRRAFESRAPESAPSFPTRTKAP